MNINLTQFNVTFNDNSICFNLQSREREGKEKYAASYYVMKREAQLMLDCMKGISTVYPFFDDISYHLKFMEYCLYVIDLSENPYKRFYYYFPFKHMTELQDRIQAWIDSKDHIEESYELTFQELRDLEFKFHDRVSWSYNDIIKSSWNEEKYILDHTLEYSVSQKVRKDILTNPELKELLKSLNRIAHNYAIFPDNPIMVILSFDNYPRRDYLEEIPSSYYFCILDVDKRRIMNGGLIAHYNEKDNSYHYSMHT